MNAAIAFEIHSLWVPNTPRTKSRPESIHQERRSPEPHAATPSQPILRPRLTSDDPISVGLRRPAVATSLQWISTRTIVGKWPKERSALTAGHQCTRSERTVKKTAPGSTTPAVARRATARKRSSN